MDLIYLSRKNANNIKDNVNMVTRVPRMSPTKNLTNISGFDEIALR
tara:strand:+ start:588 stop:725 length:138 start_codon:yes stop_codon:yes gene_type:complete